MNWITDKFKRIKPKIKNKSKSKNLLQKTTSSILNIKTHRNSIAVDSAPYFYNDSILSIRTASLKNIKSSQENTKNSKVSTANYSNAGRKR